MAERRMFSKSVTNSARFLRMPQTSRLLYYDLGMAADDDGVVEAFTVLRTTGAAEDDLRVLASRGFIQVLNDDLVSFILDWGTNNQIRKDRYNPSIYKDLLVQIKDGNQWSTSGLPDGNQRLPQDSLGEDSIDKSRPVEARAGETKELSQPPSRAVEYFHRMIDPSPVSSSMKRLREFEAELGTDVCIRAIDEAINAGKRSWNYITGILLKKQEQGVRSLADWDRNEAQRQERKTKDSVFLSHPADGQGYTMPQDLGDLDLLIEQGLVPSLGG